MFMGELVSCGCARTARATGQVSRGHCGIDVTTPDKFAIPKVMYVVTPAEAEDVVPDSGTWYCRLYLDRFRNSPLLCMLRCAEGRLR